MNILVLTDFSKNAKNALEFALEFALISKSTISVLNCFDLPHTKSSIVTSIIDVLKADSEKGLKTIEDYVKTSDRFKGISLNLYSNIGDMETIVPQVASEVKADLLLMGTKGVSAFEEFFIGSNTTRMIKSASIPVLAIPESYDYQKFDAITFASDLEPIENKHCIKVLKKMGLVLNKKVNILHILQNEETEINSVKRAVLDKMKADLQPVESNSVFVKKEKVSDGLTTYLLNSGGGFLAMIARKHSFFERLFQGSNTEMLAYRTSVPLLSIPDRK
jgi:nucleotide-binding universal stress UspA family protein